MASSGDIHDRIDSMSITKVVNSETMVPIGLAVMVVGSVATWVSSVRSDLQSHTNQIEILAKNQEAHLKLNLEINSRLSRIEWKLEEDTNGNDRKNR